MGFESLHKKIEPIIISNTSHYGFNVLCIKLAPNNIKQTTKFIEEKWSEIAPDSPFDYFFLDDSFDYQYREDERLHGKAPYDVSKSCSDLISQVYANPDVYDMPITIARCANVFGPGDLNMSRIVPGTLEAIIRKKPLKIRSNGRLIREYIYVKDSIEGYISLAENLNQTKGQAFNLASNNVLSVMQVVNKISAALNVSVRTEILDQVQFEITEQFLDGSKIEKTIGWKATSNFEESIKETYNWYRQVLSS